MRNIYKLHYNSAFYVTERKMPEAEMKIRHLMRLTVNLKNPWKIRNN